MQQLIYALQFRRPPKSSPGATEIPARATSMSITTSISDAGVKAGIEQVAGESATLENQFQLNKDGLLFFEQGTITFGAGAGKLNFSSIGVGQLLDCADPKYKAGTVMWKVDSGEGFFAGATGAITSNFLVDLKTEELIDNHLGVIYLP
jgi:hypothetical protein